MVGQFMEWLGFALPTLLIIESYHLELALFFPADLPKIFGAEFH